MHEPKNLLDVYELYNEFIKATKDSKTAKNILSETQSAIMRFLLSGLGYEKKPSGRKMTRAEVEAAKEFMKTQKMNQLLNAHKALQKGFEKLKASTASQNTYRGRFEQLLAWSQEQFWWPGDVPSGSRRRNQYCPRIRKGNGKVSSNRLTERRSQYSTYKLQPKEISESLQAELKKFYRFLTEPEWPSRLSKPITDSSATIYLEEVHLLLGWFYHEQNIPLELLSLNLLIPKITDEELEDLSEVQQKELWSQNKLAVETWICNYFKFLRESMKAFSPRTKKFKMNTLSALAKFQYYEEVVNINDYANIPVIKVVNKYSCAVRKEIKEWERQKRYVVNPEKKWPEVIEGKTVLTTVRHQILEPLRLECRFKYDNWHIRENLTIAMSLQRYLVWSFLADMPARRQEEYRSTRIALCCPIERPADVPSDGLYHPLPPAEVRSKRYDGSLEDNYLYKTYVYKNCNYPDGAWVLNIQDYKTLKTYGPQPIVIPNRRFADGSCLYDHIERYLYGWWMPGVGTHQLLYDWWSTHLKGQRGQWVTAGRASFNCGDACYIRNRTQSDFWSWGYFFVKPIVGLPYSSSNFKDLVTVAAHRLTGKRLTPHTMRYIWATWAYQVGLTDQQRESLAYAMGHDVKTLLEMYEQCTPDEKRRPIEEAIDELLFNTLELEKSKPSSTTDLEKLASELLQLPEADFQQMVLLLNQ